MASHSDSEIDLSGDGGVIKKITQEGKGKATPPSGKEVTVHYTGTLEDGTKFDSSRDRNDPFKFKLGAGQVIKGWDVCVASMLKGERCTVTLQSEYGYGANGSPPKIPPKATLIFDIELLDWERPKWEELSKGVDKFVAKAGTGYENIKPLRQVTIKYSAWFEDAHESTKNNDDDDDDESLVHPPKDTESYVALFEGNMATPDSSHSFVVGDQQVFDTFDEFVLSMKEGEKAYARIRDLSRLPADVVPPNKGTDQTQLIVGVEIDSLNEEKPMWKMDDEEKVASAEKWKAQGNDMYVKQKQYARAIARYQKAIDTIGYGSSDQVDAIKNACHNNMAACHLRLKNYRDVIREADQVLEKEPNNIKAIYRKGAAFVELDEFEQAHSLLSCVLEKQPNHVPTQQAMKRLKAKQRIQDEKDKKVYSKMFA
eukprot:CAMPEP_0201551736 /NCGR_PEP_ID=MMETSP0173_2-20130828/9179_1 /ASSEMBLY_ACC=CAM_ASM_000268 /TAXON_ID=218659 /ORGANISM="Vexillifera sp., Strain DIVA3 564/2" /LENGTH=425 /DNA_ID=CAMNT_0047962065 /DNA_START=9 /DNA_END=1286 /DNA_ORIENTATION=+